MASLSSAAAAGPGAAKQRVAIETKILPQGTFVLKPLQAGALKRDSGTVSGNWQGGPGRKVMRAGQEVTVFSGTIRPNGTERFETRVGDRGNAACVRERGWAPAEGDRACTSSACAGQRVPSGVGQGSEVLG